MQSVTATEPPKGDTVHYYESIAEVPSSIKKYWIRRHEIFSRYDDGIKLTDDLWFGVTAEPIAIAIAEEAAKAPDNKRVIIDAFGGAGGNVIQFALSGRWDQIFCVEKDPDAMACARHNAEVYGIHKKIHFINGDIFDVLKGQLKDIAKRAVIFGSPPWGGVNYQREEVFDLHNMQPYSLLDLSAFIEIASHVILFLPRNSDLRQVAQLAKGDQKLDVVHYCVGGHSNAIAVYIGFPSGGSK